MVKPLKIIGISGAFLGLLLGAPLGAHAKDSVLKKATFAGGCFWCMEPPFEKLEGVQTVISGYAGGKTAKPNYKKVLTGTTGHAEAIQITFDPKKVSYEKLLKVYWQQIDPTDGGGQFVDRGSQYRTIIFYHDAGQKITAEVSKNSLEKSGLYSTPIMTEVIPFQTFYPAESYHQNFYKTNPAQYQRYRQNSGRDQYRQQVCEGKKKAGEATPDFCPTKTNPL